VKTDEELRSDVLAELKWNPRVKSTKIGVIVKDGAVTLNGMVESLDEKVCAERAVRTVKGVRAIADDIDVKLPEQMRRTDEGIAEQAARLLNWYSTLRNMNVTAEVSSGHVTLTGDVELLYQKEIAAERVAEIEGVSGVSNRITIRRPKTVDEREVKRQIMSALHRHASVGASRIHVSIAEEKVTLDGTVDAYRERGLIEDAVRATEGVQEIVDNLQVR
jgi:osmotically-inducible protein OsmY